MGVLAFAAVRDAVGASWLTLEDCPLEGRGRCAPRAAWERLEEVRLAAACRPWQAPATESSIEQTPTAGIKDT